MIGIGSWLLVSSDFCWGIDLELRVFDGLKLGLNFDFINFWEGGGVLVRVLLFNFDFLIEFLFLSIIFLIVICFLRKSFSCCFCWFINFFCCCICYCLSFLNFCKSIVCFIICCCFKGLILVFFLFFWLLFGCNEDFFFSFSFWKVVLKLIVCRNMFGRSLVMFVVLDGFCRVFWREVGNEVGLLCFIVVFFVCFVLLKFIVIFDFCVFFRWFIFIVWSL